MSKKFELALVSNEAFREIFQSMTEGIVVVDERGLIVVINNVAEEMFGYDQDELIGKNVESLIPANFRTHHVHHREGFNHNPSPRKMGHGRDLKALKKDGQEFPVEISLSFSRASGTFIAIAFISDISWRKKSEEALKRSEEQLIVYASELERKVQARTEDLKASVRKLEQEVKERQKAEMEMRKALDRERELNEMKSRFVSIASHEFRTPLSTVLSSVSLIEQYKERNELDKIDKHTNRVRSSVHHLTSILNDFLSVGKLEEGKVETNPGRINLETLLFDLVEEIKGSLKEGQQILVRKMPVALQFISDERILRNILLNLLSNASKYSATGKRIYITSELIGNSLSVSVRDEGIGIPDQEQKNLFERFFRATNASSIQGTGLGLNIVKRYAELLKGSIVFESVLGKGSTFTVTIPALEPNLQS